MSLFVDSSSLPLPPTRLLNLDVVFKARRCLSFCSRLKFLTFSSLFSLLSAGQEVERLSLELVGCRRHLEAAQKDGSQWQAEVLSLAEQLANAQRQLHLTR